jgi:hypothetical protein
MYSGSVEQQEEGCGLWRNEMRWDEMRRDEMRWVDMQRDERVCAATQMGGPLAREKAVDWAREAAEMHYHDHDIAHTSRSKSP